MNTNGLGEGMRALALLSGAALSAAVVTACGGGTDSAPAPEVSPTPPPESGGMDGFRAFAALIDNAVTRGDATLIEARAVSRLTFSSGDVVSFEEPPQRARFSFERLVSEAVAEQSDEFGGGEAVLYALARRAEEPAYGESRYQAIVTAIIPLGYMPGVYRTIGVFEFAIRDDRWRLVGVLMDPHSGATAHPSPSAWLRGECDICFDHWERWEGTS